MSDFSMALNEDQLTLQNWVHELRRRRGPTRTQRNGTRAEAFPWPVVEQAR